MRQTSFCATKTRDLRARIYLFVKKNIKVRFSRQIFDREYRFSFKLYMASPGDLVF